MIRISNYLDSKQIIFLDAEHRDDVLTSLIDLGYQCDRIPDKKLFYDSILEREKIVSTGIGMGVAIPHAKLPDYEDFFICVGILKQGVDWGSLDSAPVRIVFMIGGPDDKQTEYLQILSNLTLAIKDEGRRKKILTVNSSEAIIQLFKAI